ncbi:MAG: 3-isopropylmalate dehydratase large subunit [Chloroflexi bacterium]|nr:3-isopropylmalate dehydratase large subunit [Chloroflexota bacterium]
MGKTITEKILAKACGKAEVFPGDYLNITPTRPVTLAWLYQRGCAQFDAVGAARVFDPRLVNVVNGHHGVTASHSQMEVRGQMKKWCQKVGIPPSNIYDLGRQGIEHVVSGERCWALPGTVFVEVVNGHGSSLGALGAFAFSLGYESGAYLVTGRTWVQVPETIKINLTGSLQEGVTARDIFEHVLGAIGAAGAPGQVMEWTGPAIDALGMDGRFTVCCGALFTGAWTAIVNPDGKTLDYVRARTNEPFEPVSSDPDASFARVHEFDVSQILPQVVSPPRRNSVSPVARVEGTKINRGFIGSCFNSRLEDMRMAAGILKGKKIAPDVVLNITPGTMGIYRECLREGLIEIFAEAEATVPPPACGMCTGSNTPLASGDVCISTSTCNWPGRMGSREAEIYLASPATVAASCIAGRITDPRNHPKDGR